MSAADGPILVTGALGCIGSWTVRELLATGAQVVALDPAGDTRRLAMLTSPDLMSGMRLVPADITDLGTIEQLLVEHGVQEIIHLAALQLPFCRADPPRGAAVNVLGTVNVFEAARRAGVTRVVFTSSVAVFDQKGGRVESDATPRPASHYGVYKLANEGTARAYWHDFGVSSIGIRPMTVYGPGRDRGLTSSPTKAILAAVLGCSYEIGFGGSSLFHHAGDVARALVAAVRTSTEGARILNLNGAHATVSEILETLRDLLGQAADGITAKTEPIPFPDDVDTTGLDVIGPPTVTPLHEGIADTVRFFSDLRSRGALVPEDHGLLISNGAAVDRESPPDAP
ncbi:MAG: NAD(P)-dependent oxidoreductase [Acidimicrobiia bacterium]